MLPTCTLFKIQHSFPISLSHLGRGIDEGLNSNSCNTTSMDCVIEYLYHVVHECVFVELQNAGLSINVLRKLMKVGTCNSVRK